MLKQELGLKQQQKLSPLQIQTIKLIELPAQELEQRIRREIEENPVLDESSAEDGGSGADVSISDLKEDDAIPAYKLYVNNYGKDPLPQYDTFSVKQSFTQSLLEQVGFRRLTDHEHAIAVFLVGSLDNDGYLRRDIESLVDDLAFRANISTTSEEIMKILHIIQDLDPPGVGARDLKECLLLQLKNIPESRAKNDAITILTKYYNEFTGRHFAKIMGRMGIDKEQMQEAIDKIVHLNPSPGGQTDDSYDDKAQQIIPDFTLDLIDDELVLSMPRFNIPSIKISKKYSEMLENAEGGDKKQKDATSFVKRKLDSAKWFIEALKQRYNTLKTTMQAIVDYQHDYFMDGDETNMRPMVLKDIAEKTGYDISTISRVANSKYIETHFGIFPLKYFFSEGMENNEGEEVSTRELKKVLRDCVDGENKQKPLTDDQLVKVMALKGYKLARRTVAKYREQLDIPMARLRKEL